MSRQVVYLYNEEMTNFQFSKDHFMKPRRIKMAHSLIQTFELTPQMTWVTSKEATVAQLQSFHHPHYVKYLQSWVKPSPSVLNLETVDINEGKYKQQFIKDSTLGSIFKVNQILDCPGFAGLFNFCKLAVGGSLDAADSVISGLGQVVINWGGGYHHAKKSQASGFCYVNDIVICILQLLKIYPRVLYLDIDVHHGDGVQQAFYQTNRVMTVSFHQHQEGFFPETGAIENVGEGTGKYFAVNVPLKRGIDDQTYIELFKAVMVRTMGSFRPDVVVIQCGADSLSRDKLGSFNLSIRGHGQCLKYMRQTFNTPIILLGGGGYTIQNVARCWAYQTSLMLNSEIGNEVPPADPFHYYYMKDDYKIHFEVEKGVNMNSGDYLHEVVKRVSENLREGEMAPSVGFHHAPERTRREEVEGKGVERMELERRDK